MHELCHPAHLTLILLVWESWLMCWPKKKRKEKKHNNYLFLNYQKVNSIVSSKMVIYKHTGKMLLWSKHLREIIFRQFISPTGLFIIVYIPTNWFLRAYYGNLILTDDCWGTSEAEQHNWVLKHCLLRRLSWSSRQGTLLSLGSLSSLMWIINWSFVALPLYTDNKQVTVAVLHTPLTWALLHRHLLLIIKIHCPNLHILICITQLLETKDRIYCGEMTAQIMLLVYGLPGQLLVLKDPDMKHQSVSI